MTDNLLKYDSSTGEVILTEQAQHFQSFKDLKAADKTQKKLTFSAQLKVLYFMFSDKSKISQRYTPAQRMQFIYKEIVRYNQSRIETPEFKRCWKMMIRHGMTREEAQFHQIQTDFDNWLIHLNNIPWEKEIIETIKEGKKERKKSYIISNSDERMKAVKHSKDILTLQKELEVIVAGQKRSKEQSKNKERLFEDPDYLDSIETGENLEIEPNEES